MTGRPSPRGLLFEGDSYIALDKPAGVSMATAGRKENPGEEVVARLFEALSLTLPEPPPLLVHRLDVGTSGVVLLARDVSAQRLASLAFSEGRVSKTYRALCWGTPIPPAGILRKPLGRDRSDGRRMRVDPQGKSAVTAYRTLDRHELISDLVLTPETGRTHQIRVHLAAEGHAVVGDDLYSEGARWRGIREPHLREALASLGRPLLHAWRLVCPALGLDVTAPLPEEFARLAKLLFAVSGRCRSRR